MYCKSAEMRSVTEQNSVSFVVQCRKPRQQDHSKSRRMLIR